MCVFPSSTSLQVSYMIVDTMHKLYPDILQPPGTKDASVPPNILSQPHLVDSPPSKTASLNGQSEVEKSSVVKVSSVMSV